MRLGLSHALVDGLSPALRWSAAVGAAIAALGVLRGTVGAARRRWRYQRALKLHGYRGLSPHAFEQLVADYYRNAGYQVRLTASPGASDGGVDLIARRSGQLLLIQCKHWRANVGVAVVREMYGLLHHHAASAGVIVTTGRYSADAHRFAERKPIELVDGEELLRRMSSA